MAPKKLEGLAPQRKRAGMSQEALAALVGVTRANVANWETGFAWPKARMLPEIADALACSLDDLYHMDKTEEGENAERRREKMQSGGGRKCRVETSAGSPAAARA